jgi:hypothetical protein
MLHSMLTRRYGFGATLVACVLGFASGAHAVVVVNDTWKDGTDTDPGVGNANFDGLGGVNGNDFLIWQRNAVLTGGGTLATGDANGDTNVNAADLTILKAQFGSTGVPTQYSENGVDGDGDGDIESTWFRGGTGATLDPVGVNGPLRGVPGTGSASFTTYFTPESAPVTLGAAGDQLKVTWTFKPTSVANDTTNTGQSFRLAVVDSPSSLRVTADGASPGNSTTDDYNGYAMFMNMDQTLRRSSPFSLMRRVGPGGFLGTSDRWSTLIDDGTTNDPGYVSDNLYTYTMTITRNAADGLDIVSRMEGAGLGPLVEGVPRGYLEAVSTDAAPPTFAFDTFGVRPSSAATTATMFDTSSFKVEKLTVMVASAVPEPSALVSGVMALAALAGVRRRRA